MRFEREQCLDLDAAFARTWLLTDPRGGLAAGSLLGCPASRHHGLLVAPAGPDGALHVFLSRLEEWLVEGERALPISSARYPGVIEPSGHTYLASFDVLRVPTWHYQVGDVEITREIELLPPPGQGVLAGSGHGVFVRWTVKAPRGARRRLRVRPFLACRPADGLTFENPHADLSAKPVSDGVCVQPYASLPAVRLRMSHGATFTAAPDWYRRYEHVQDLAAGREGHEDHLTPGWFEIELRGSAHVVFVASIDRPTKERLQGGRVRRLPARFKPRLRDVLDQAALRHFRFLAPKEGWLRARLPWPGDDPAAQGEGMQPFLATHGQSAALLSTLAHVPAKPWVALAWSRGWLASVGARESARFRSRLVERLFHLGQTLRTRAAADPSSSGLVSGSETGGSSRVDVVVNTRWVALAHGLARLSRGASKRVAPERQGWTKTAREVARAFRERFWLEDEGYLADGWADGKPDTRVRPGMLVAAAEPTVPLSKAERRSIVERARVELLTPRGLRTLSPRDPAYSPDPGPRAPQPPQERKGAVEPRWLLPYAEATLLARGRSAAVKKSLRALVQGFEPHLAEHGLGCIAEVFDGEAPHRASGAPSDARSITALLGVLALTGGGTR